MSKDGGRGQMRCKALLRPVIGFAMLALLSAAPVSAGACMYARALDGDDIIIGGQDYRLEGIDAFENGQWCLDDRSQSYNCSAKATAALAAIINAACTQCSPTGKKHGNRLIANCTAGSRDVEAEMVQTGWAVVRPDFIPDPARKALLCAIEAQARATKAGAWAGTFVHPYLHKGGRNKPLSQVSCL